MTDFYSTLASLLGGPVEPDPPGATDWTLERRAAIRKLQAEIRGLEFELETQAEIDAVVERTLLASFPEEVKHD